MTRQTRQNKISRISFRRRCSDEVEKDKGEGKEKDNDYYKRHERRQKQTGRVDILSQSFHSEAEDSENGEGVVGAAKEIWPPAERNQVFEQFEIQKVNLEIRTMPIERTK